MCKKLIGIRQLIENSDPKIAHNFTSIDEAVDIIKSIYNENAVCLGDILSSIEIQGCNLEEVVQIVAKARKIIDGWNMYMTGNEESDICDIAEGKWSKSIT